MNLSHHSNHLVIIAMALMLALIAAVLPRKAWATSVAPGYYTTTSESTTTTSTTNGVTTSTTRTTTQAPRGLYSTRDRGWRSRDYWRDRERTTDIEARYPYDSTNGRNRSDVDAVRSGFDDPRNPWDGRYSNDHPSNSAPRGSNETVNSMRGNEIDRFRPGRYGTKRVWPN